MSREERTESSRSSSRRRAERRKRARRRRRRIILVIVAIIIAAIAAVAIIFLKSGDNSNSEGNEAGTEVAAEGEETSTMTETESAAAGLVFPYALDDGKLSVDSVFQYSGVNPDADQADADNTAAIQLTNNSGTYLANADVIVTLLSGVQYEFQVESVPAGGVICAFDLKNQTYDNSSVDTVQCTAEYGDNNLLNNGITATVDGMKVEIENNSGSDIEHLNVYYHDVIDDVLFGGKASVAECDGGTGELTLESLLESVAVTAVIAE